MKDRRRGGGRDDDSANDSNLDKEKESWAREIEKNKYFYSD